MKRYDLWGGPEGEGEMDEAPDGNWVDYEDHIAAMNKLLEMVEYLQASMQGECDGCIDDNGGTATNYQCLTCKRKYDDNYNSRQH